MGVGAVSGWAIARDTGRFTILKRADILAQEHIRDNVAAQSPNKFGKSTHLNSADNLADCSGGRPGAGGRLGYGLDAERICGKGSKALKTAILKSAHQEKDE